jgi:DNA polymerase delta subunit 3
VRPLLLLAIANERRMLFEFHQHQNSKKPGTIHATYLISGTKPKAKNVTEGQKDGEDEYMQSSPFMGSSMPQPSEETGEMSILSISLVREEDLESTKAHIFHMYNGSRRSAGLKSQYEHIISIHVYSIGPHPLKASLIRLLRIQIPLT